MAGSLMEIGKSIITQCLLPPIKIHFDYWWCFDNNIQGLINEVGDLESKIYDINQKIEAARLRTEILRPVVEEWPKTGTEKLVEARRILQDDNIPKSWDLISRYSMGKRAKKAAEEIAEHRNGGNFDAISDPAPPPARGSTSHISTMDFDSRKRIEEEIIKSLKKSSVGMIGICGMGGVGKTTMAQRIRERVMEEKLFDEVVMVVVSQPIDMPKIQKEVAELLGLEFNVESMPARADKLRKRLMDTNRKIIIFDDVWQRLKLEDLGIPFGSGFERCKIVLTTRSKELCEEMEAQEITRMEILTEEEAWILFKEKAGNHVEDLTLLSLAKDIVAECKGLPIALVTVGKALQHNKKSIWKNSLSQLRRSNPLDFPKFLENVYKPLKLSYDYLDNELEQLLFLLCCLFPEDYDIPVEQLTLYSMGLQLFDGISSIEEARNRAHTLVEKLKSRFLLIDSWNELHVRMHDVVRDVAIYIGSKEKNGFLKSLNKTSIESSSDANCNWMSVDMSNERIKIPVALRFPKLRLLMLLKSSSNKFSDISFEGKEDLNVLSFSRDTIESLPPTLGLLQNLRTLYLYSCTVENISVIGELTSLEAFSCRGCININELPAEIGRLNCLRLLELNECGGHQRIPFGILSSLVQLEELKIRKSFKRWEADENGKEMRNASLTELERLPKLSCLEIEISDSNLAAQEICLSQKLVKYKIYIGSTGYWYGDRDHEKLMNLNLPSEIGAVGNWIRLLVRNSETLCLNRDGSNNINIEECQDLRKLEFRNCSRVKKLVKTKDCKSGIVFPLLETLNLWRLENLEEIFDGTILLNQKVSLCNLKSLEICECSNLRTLFSVSIARSLLQLQVLWIEDCDAMERVFWNDITYHTDASIEFPKLKKLRLENLPNLTAFCQGVQTIKFPELTEMDIRKLPKLNSLCPLNSETTHDDTTSFHFLFNQKVEIGGGLEILTLSELGDNISNIWCQQIPINFFNNLKNLIITNLNGIRSLMSTSIAKNLVSLESLRISSCKEMVEVIEDDTTDASIEFPMLKTLGLAYLPNLTAFCQEVQTIKFPELTEMAIGGLPKLNSLCPLNSETTHDDTTSFHFLCNQKVEIGGLEIRYVGGFNNNFRNIWCHQVPMNFINNLQKLVIFELNGMRSLMPYSIAKNLVSIKYLEISDCEEMVEVIEGNDDDREVLVDDIKCLFPTLKKLEIENLSKLRWFWQWNHALELPLLEVVTIDGCPVMKTFTMGFLNTPNLKRWSINQQANDDRKDLNDVVSHKD